jgi:AhpC/TSA family
VPGDEDRFGDLGRDEPEEPADQRSAAEKLEERDRTHPEPVEERPEVPRPGNRYAWLVGIVMLMGLAVLLFTTTIPNQGEGVLGLERGERLPAFAAPLATGTVEGDANVCQRHPTDPCPEGAGPIPACDVRSRQIVNLCRLRKRPLVLTFIVDRGANCFPQVDRVERVRDEFPEVNFATVYFSRKDRDEVREIVRRRRWRQPVALDRDGGLVNRYGVGVCPTTVFAYRGGRASRDTNLGELTEAELRREIRRLLRRQTRRDRR